MTKTHYDRSSWGWRLLTESGEHSLPWQFLVQSPLIHGFINKSVQSWDESVHVLFASQRPHSWTLHWEPSLQNDLLEHIQDLYCRLICIPKHKTDLALLQESPKSQRFQNRSNTQIPCFFWDLRQILSSRHPRKIRANSSHSSQMQQHGAGILTPTARGRCSYSKRETWSSRRMPRLRLVPGPAQQALSPWVHISTPSTK